MITAYNFLGDVGFDERELLRDAHFDESYLKSPRQDISMQPIEKSHSMIAETSTAPAMDVDLPLDDGFGGGGFMGKF